MECGSQETLCQALAWLTENELAARKFNDLIVKLGQDATGGFAVAIDVVKNYGQTIIGLLGFSFGVWRWWLYHERVLHKRLEQYITDSDQRLQPAQEDLLEIIQRPGPSQVYSVPMFADADLASVLRERRWDTSVHSLSVARNADWQLSSAIDRIKRRLEAATSATTSLQKQLAAANTLRGAIASSLYDTPSKAELALACFRNALRMPHHRMSIFAKELEAHQLRRIGDYKRAANAYQELLKLTSILDAPQQSAINARAKRYFAEIVQAQKITEFFSGGTQTPASVRAKDLMLADEGEPGALVIKSNFPAYQGWELLESAEMTYFSSFVCALLGASTQADDHLQNAVDGYDNVVRSLDSQGASHRRAHKKLLAQAQQGLKRAQRAASGDYDITWLVPFLTVDQTKQITARIRAACGK
jgi:tetratricopeptide (TPR) repeat protein